MTTHEPTTNGHAPIPNVPRAAFFPHTPPPPPPSEPVYSGTTAMHLTMFLLGFPTLGLTWLLWPFVALATSNANARRRRAYEKAKRDHVALTWYWQQAQDSGQWVEIPAELLPQ